MLFVFFLWRGKQYLFCLQGEFHARKKRENLILTIAAASTSAVFFKGREKKSDFSPFLYFLFFYFSIPPIPARGHLRDKECGKKGGGEMEHHLVSLSFIETRGQEKKKTKIPTDGWTKHKSVLFFLSFFLRPPKTRVRTPRAFFPPSAY